MYVSQVLLGCIFTDEKAMEVTQSISDKELEILVNTSKYDCEAATDASGLQKGSLTNCSVETMCRAYEQPETWRAWLAQLGVKKLTRLSNPEVSPMPIETRKCNITSAI